MNRIGWPLVEIASKLLEREEREAVLGDLLELNESAGQALRDVMGLFFRRQALLWKDLRPWLAGFGVTLPGSYLLMCVSASVSCTYQRLIYNKVFDAKSPTGHEGVLLLLCHTFLLIAWSWAAGYVVGAISRRTLWVKAALCVFSCVFCFSTFWPPVSGPWLFLFLLPGMVGIRHGLRKTRITVRGACVMAVTITVLMISAWSSKALWIFNWALIWPARYVVAIAWRQSTQEGRTGPFAGQGEATVRV
jgi:hypothetical protein